MTAPPVPGHPGHSGRAADHAGRWRVDPGHRRRCRRARRPRLDAHTDHTRAHHRRAGAQVELPWHPGYNALLYALAGAGTVGTSSIRLGQLAVFGAGDALRVTASPSQDSRTTQLEL
ncbi:pirin-like C-terminal cupin domain-containing protein [Lentzea atacamensis]|uniref:pirin-like C-terminal cupin domain-containing protein n=1 Tax=Lentzea atacamensis TaxID=531938 RepID=UPI001F386A85|nr:pirin-like C-terminal cupin domain-containing protein [Lentzea atacamensis]